jgi:threonine synthase
MKLKPASRTRAGRSAALVPGPGTDTPSMRCAGCGMALPDTPYPFRCPRADELPEVDHVVRRSLPPGVEIEPEGHPFLRYRRFLHAWHFARARGLDDAAYAGLVRHLDDEVARVEGHGLSITPLRRYAALEAGIGMKGRGAVWIKDETGGVAGSHKARHLMGIMIQLEVVRALGLDDPRGRGLAIASCGNAALAAAVVARAAGYPLRVFVPASADPAVLDRIASLGATTERCSRTPGVPGDPSYRRFRGAVAAGALPFCCQGPDNGLTIDGGATLWLEVAEALGGTPPDRVYVQVGGGALASACVQAFTDMHAAGRLPRIPALHAVQTRGAHPLERAYLAVRARLLGDPADPTAITAAMRHARTHRSAFMWPWESVPHSTAHGILDDETYDWAAVVEGMLRSGGAPIVVDEDALHAANHLARDTTHVEVSHTGSAGLAGLVQLLAHDPASRREQHVVIFSGAGHD